MAIETARYVKPGNYVGMIIQPAASTITGFPRLPCFVGKGSRYIRYKNAEIRRAYISDEELTFTGVGPYNATLTYESDGNKANTIVVDGNGTILSGDRYTFTTVVSGYDGIIIPTTYYDPTATYYISYQSVDRDVQDAVPFDDLRQIERVGRGVDSKDYVEFVDYYIPVTVGTPAADSGNANLTDETYGTTNGNTAEATILGVATPADDIIITAVTAGPTGNGIQIVTVSSAVPASTAVTENTTTRVVTITYETAVATTTAIVAAAAALTLVDFAGVGLGAWGAGQDAQSAFTSSVDAAITTSTGNVFFSTTSDYTHNYDRDYTLECTASGDDDNAVFVWYSAPNSLGNSMAPRSPYHTSMDEVAVVANVIDLSTGNTDISLEYGLKVSFHDNGGAGFTDGDTWTFRAFGPGRIEADSRHSNTNQFISIGSVTEVDVDPGTLGVLAVESAAADYSGTYNRTYYLVVSAINAGVSATILWTAVGDDGVATGTTGVVLDGGTATLDNGFEIAIDISAGDFTVGDRYSIAVSAARLVSSIKDDRTITIEVNTGPATGDVDFVYSVDTPEGGTGVFTATTADPHIEFAGNLVLHVRNLIQPRYDEGDAFTCTVTLGDVIDWSLLTEEEETISSDDIILDTIGSITGTAGNYYVVLAHAPTTVVLVVDTTPTVLTGYSIVTDSSSNNTRYLDLGATDPADDITVTYRWLGSEPAPGQYYFFSALYLRNSTLYNTPILIQSEESGEALLAPTTSTNHLALVNRMTWQKFNPVGVYFCQVADADQDGVFQDSDFDTAIEGTEGTKRITDLCVLDGWGSLNTQINQIDALANPLEKAFRMVWLGAPTDTAIGDADTAGSLVYTAANTLTVYGDNPAHGTRVMVAPTECTYSLVLEDNSSQEIILDGSFVAAAAMLTYASFEQPWRTMLRTNLTAFETVQTYTESENLTLGENQINFLSQTGDGIYRWEEDVTTDRTGTENSADEFRIISAMIQKKHILDGVDNVIESTIIGLVPDDVEGGIEAIRNAISGYLGEEVQRGSLGRYQDEDGNSRKLNPATDIRVFRDTTQKTLYRYWFAFFLKYPIKRTFGLAKVDSNNFGLEAV